MNACILLIAWSLMVMSCVPSHADRHYLGGDRHSDRSEIQDIRRACQAGNRRACVALGAAIEQRQGAHRDSWDWRERRWNAHDRWDRRDRRWDRNDRDNPFLNDPRFQGGNNSRDDRENPFLNDPRFQGDHNPRD